MNMQGTRFCLAGTAGTHKASGSGWRIHELLWTFPFHRWKIQIFLHKTTPKALFLQEKNQGTGEDHSQGDGHGLRWFSPNKVIQIWTHKPFKSHGLFSHKAAQLCLGTLWSELYSKCSSWDLGLNNTWTPPASILLHPLQLVPLFQESYSAVPGEEKRCYFSMIKGSKLKLTRHRDTALFCLITSALESIEWSSQGSGEAAAVGFDATWS